MNSDLDYNDYSNVSISLPYVNEIDQEDHIDGESFAHFTDQEKQDCSTFIHKVTHKYRNRKVI